MEFLCIALGRYARNNENLVLVFDTDGLVLTENGKSYEYVRLNSGLEIYVVLAKVQRFFASLQNDRRRREWAGEKQYVNS